MRELLNILFDETDLICSGDLYANSVSKLDKVVSSEFFCINALSSVDHDYKKGEKRSYMTPRRADVNVACFRNFMFEMDSLPLDDQQLILHNCEVPWTSIVYSGGKSYHAILSLEDPLGGVHTVEGMLQYKHVWRKIEALVNKYAYDNGYKGQIIDPSSKNPSRFSRYPGYTANGRKQQVNIYRADRCGVEDFSDLMLRCPEVKQVVAKSERVDVEISSIEDFWKMCPDSLAMKLKYPMGISSEGNYHDLFKLALWAIDSTGVTKDAFIELCNEHIFPKYRQANYPEHKWMNGIDHAYSSKGM